MESLHGNVRDDGIERLVGRSGHENRLTIGTLILVRCRGRQRAFPDAAIPVDEDVAADRVQGALDLGQIQLAALEVLDRSNRARGRHDGGELLAEGVLRVTPNRHGVGFPCRPTEPAATAALMIPQSMRPTVSPLGYGT